jgi:TonB family protein
MVLRRDQRKDDSPACFTVLPDGKSRSAALLAAIVADFLLGLLILAIPAGLPRQIAPGTRLSTLVLPAPPVVRKPRPPAPGIPMPPPREKVMMAPVLPSPRPKLEPRRLRVAEPPVLTPEFQAPAPVYHAIERPRPAIQTGVLSPSVAPPAAKRAPPKVQTGGFGDPAGVPATGSAQHGLAVPTVGSFGSPMGPGSGNGTGGSRGARGEIAGAGFGDAVASPAQDGNARRGESVHAGVFSDQTTVPAANAPAPHTEKPAIQLVEILEKPDPVYTAEARARRIEGNVVLEVIFTADGSVEILRVVRGLGYGLDQEAIDAARRIRFRPERVDGKPVDEHARLQIVFRLAY